MHTDSNLLISIKSLTSIANALRAAIASKTQNINYFRNPANGGLSRYWRGNFITSLHWIVKRLLPIDHPVVVRKAIIIIAGVILCNFSLLAQVSLTVQLTPPYDVPLDDMKEQITLTVNAPAGASGELRVNFTRTTDEGVIARTIPNLGKIINIGREGSMTYTGSDFNDMFVSRNMEFIGVTANEALFDDGLPPGEYSLCFYLIDTRSGGTTGSGCTNFTVPEPTVTISTSIVPPFNVPFADLSEQVSVVITSSRGINDGLLRMTLTGDDGINISTNGRGMPVQLDKNIPLTLTGSDLDMIFASANLNFSGISPGEANENGLPPGDYQICFRLWYNGEQSQTGRPPDGCRDFTIDPPVISINTTINPPYDNPFAELSEQVRVTVNSPIDIDDGFFTMSLQGNNGINITTKNTAKDFLQIEKNVPFVATGPDLEFHFNSANLNFQGITPEEVNENGLPPGDYELCFRLWYDDNDPATDGSAGCTNFIIDRGMVTMTMSAIPPYDVPFNEFGDQTTVTINSTQMIDDGFLSLRLIGDNGIQIASLPGAQDFLQIEKNIPLSLTGSDLSFLFQGGNLNFQGTTAAEVNESGLPPGDYELCFRLWYADSDPATDFICSNFRIDRGVVTLSTRIVPPYDIPLADLADQVTVSLNSAKAINEAFLRLLITGDNGIEISSKPGQKELIDIEGNTPLTLTGTDLDFHFNSVNLNFVGISTNEANANGLPPGEYELCFQLWYGDGDPATEAPPSGCTAPFTIDRGMVSINTTLTPPHDQPFEELSGQTTVIINSSQGIDDGFLTLLLTGDNGIQISTKTTSKEFIQVEENVPLTLTGGDLSFWFNPANLDFQGITASEVNEYGLPPGNYDLCFRLWYDDNDPATDEGMGCNTFNIGQGVVTLNTIFTPPYTATLLDMADQVTVNISSTQTINDGFLQLLITGDNGVEIVTMPGKKSLIDILKNEPLSLSGSDLGFYFDPANLNFQGTTASAVNENGLPTGNYELCFRLWYNDDEPATGEPPIGCTAPFTIGEGIITINTVVTPPYNLPLEELLAQTSVNITSTTAIDDGFITLDLTGDNGIHIASSAGAVKELLQIFQNEPAVIYPLDLIELNGAGTTFEGISYTDAIEHGLPSGNYELCFRLWYSENEPATDEGSGCAMFTIQQGVVTINTVITPPYEIPFSELSDQVTITLLSSQRIQNAYLTLLLEEGDADFQIRTDVTNVSDRYDLETNEPLTLTGTDLTNMFATSNLIFQGIDPGELSENGLPPGNYTLCFRLWYEDGEPATDEIAGCANFSIGQVIVSLNTIVIPPYNLPFSELSEQVNVTINANRNLDDVFLRMHLQGGDGIQLETVQGAKELFDVEENIPQTLTGLDLDFLFNTTNLTLQGIAAGQLNNYGLPPGTYDLCFQLWYNDSEPATDEMQGCYQFTIQQSNFTMAAQVIPPYTPLIEDMASMTHLTLMSSANTGIILRMRITGDNDIEITNNEAFFPMEVIELDANTPLMLSDLDLTEYFAANSLAFSGISQREALSNGLPEGNYQVCFTALTPDGIPIDMPEACSNMFQINYVEPPQVLTPECGSVISTSEAQALIFNWMPAIGAPADTEYTLKIVELLNPNQDPNDAILSSTTPSFLEETVVGTSFFYGPAQPILEPGRKYAFLVYVDEDISRGNYINQGLSQVCYFILEDEEDLVVSEDDDILTKDDVMIKPIIDNPFPGYLFPISQVSGTLKYKFKGTSGETIFANANQVGISSYQTAMITSSGNGSTNNTGSDSGSQVFAQAQSSDNSMSNVLPQNYIVKPKFNQSNILSTGTKPLANVNVSLLQTYILFGEINGQSVSGKVLQDGDIKQNKNGFESNAAPGWNQVVATTTTDANGNFSFNVLQFDSLGGSVDVDWSSTSGDLYSTHMHVKGRIYKTYRLIVESPYYCSPDMNILVQPWESVDLGTLVSYVRSYNLRVYTKKLYNDFYDYNLANDPILTNVETKLYRDIPIGQVPTDEGQHDYYVPSPQQIMQERLVGEGKTNAEGYFEFNNLVRHNANNTLDHYQIVCTTNEYVGSYNFKKTEAPYPVFPYSSDWDWKNDKIAITFGLPTSQDYGYGVFPIYNSQFAIETYTTTLEMKPELPRVVGQVLSKQAEVTPKDDPNPINSSFVSASSGGQIDQFQTQGGQSDAVGSGFNLSTNSSANTFANSNFYLDAMGFIDMSNWSNKVNMAPIPNAPMRMIAIAAKDHSFTGITTVPTDAKGQYKFEGLQIEFNLEALNNENALDDELWTSIVGPARSLLALVPGYKSESRDLGILKWGDQRIVDFELEPDGYVFGYVEDEWGNPVKAEVFVDSLVSTTTVMSAEYQQILGIPMPLKEVFVLKAPSGNNRKLHVVPDDLIFVPGTFEVNIEKNQDEYQPQNLGAFEVGTYKHRIKLRVVEQMKYIGDIAVQPPVKNALVRVTNILNSSPDENNQTSGEGTTSGNQFQISTGNLTSQGVSENKQNVQGQSQNNVISAESASGTIQTLSSDKYYAYTDANGYVELVFENNGHHFDIEIIPPADKDLVSKTITLYSESTGETIDHGFVELAPAFRISGKVTYGPNSIPLENARVLIDQGGENLETRTDAQGNYTLKGIPLSQNQWSVSAENVDHPLTLVADSKTIVQPFPQTVDFNLTVFDKFEIKELMGFPVTVTAVEEVNGEWFVTGAFINLPDNPNFKVKEEEARLKFFDIQVAPKLVQGKNIAVPVDASIVTETDRLDLINYTTLIAEQTPETGNLLKVTADAQGKGFIAGKVDVLSTSFQFEENYMSFNQANTSNTGGQSGNSNKGSNMLQINNMVFQQGTASDIAQDAIGKGYLYLFTENTSIRLYEPANNEQKVTTIKAITYPVRSFGVTNASGGDYAFKVQNFKAKARKQDSYVFKDSVVLATTLITNNIPNIIPQKLEIDLGAIRVTAQGYEKITGDKPIQFKLEEWEVVCEDWELDQYSTGIKANKGTLKTSLFHTAMKNIKITPNDFDPGAVDLNNITFGGVVPVTIESNSLAFGMNPACTYDNQPHWMLKVTGLDGNPGASIQNLPGMLAGDRINIESFTIYSNDEKELNVGDQQQNLLFYDIVNVSPTNFTVVEGGMEMTAMMDLNIPRLNESIGGFRYVKNGNQVESIFKGMEVNFEALGKVKFTGIDQEGAQTLAQGTFDAKGKISDAEGILLLGRLHKDKDSTYVIVEPLHQQLPIADDGSNKLIEITGDMHVVGPDWEHFIFSGDLYGMKGVEDSQKRKTFTVYGSINAEGEGMDVKNINADFAGISMTYDIQNARLTGELEFEQNFSSISISGKANLLADRDGWYFMANGAMEVPGFGNLKAGLGIGDYGKMAPDMKTTLLANAYDKTIPPSFQNGFSGFFFTGRKNFPQFSIPKTEFNFIIVSGSLSGETGLDARLWMGFDDNGAEFGIGVMAYAYIDVSLTGAITCTSVYGHVGAELGVKGMYNTGNSTFSLQGCGAIILAGKVEQCFGALGACCWDCCVSTEGSTALKVDMLIDSNGTFDASLGFGSCSGNVPSLGGNW